MIRKIGYLLFAISVISCGKSKNSKDPDNETLTEGSSHAHSSVKEFALVEPIKKAIYYMNEVDIATYDSIATQYFHEVLDYTDSAAISIELKIHQLENVIVSDTSSEVEKKSAADKISELSLDLIKYEKSVTGYVFVHTFLNKGDTLSAIIITNADMTKGSAIPVSKVSDIEPSAFADDIRKIEQ
ncbi:hypothetical protein [Parvicella tangerina]|nr:hypothetical protein [Parvicella tangerina]